MIIGSSVIDYGILCSCYPSISKIKRYSNSLIPQEFRGIKQIEDNQLYYVTLSLRKMPTITDYKLLKKVIAELMDGVLIIGYSNEVIELSNIWQYVDYDIVTRYLERG